MFDYLSNFNERMNYAIIYQYLYRNIYSKSIWTELGFPENKDTWFGTVFAVLVYIANCAVMDTKCTEESLAYFLEDFLYEQFEMRNTKDEYRLLARFILQDVLTNAGKPMEKYNWDKTGKTEYVSVINAKYEEDDSGKTRAVYYMTQEGLMLVFATREFEDYYNIDIQNMILHMRLESGNYKDALYRTRQIHAMLVAQRQKVRSTITEMRKNITAYSEKEYIELLNDDISKLTESNRKYNDFQDTIRKHIEDLEQANWTEDDVNEKNRESLQDLNEIVRWLRKIVNEQYKVIQEHEEMKAVFHTELLNALRQVMAEHVSCEKAYMQPVLKDASLILPLMEKILMPIFIQPPVKVFDALTAFIPMEMAPLPEEKGEEMDDFDREKEIDEARRKDAQQLDVYRGILLYLLGRIMETDGHRFSLASIETKLNHNEDARKLLIPTIQDFIYVYNILFQEEIIRGQNEDLEEEKFPTIQNMFRQIIHNAIGTYDFILQVEKDDRIITIRNIDGEDLEFTNLILSIVNRPATEVAGLKKRYNSSVSFQS